MLTTTTSSAPFEPPLPTTINTLKAKERAELVRRTRKLEQVLGVAMHVVEARNSVKEAAPSASASAGAGGAGGSSQTAFGVPDASSSNSGHVPRRRAKIPKAPQSKEQDLSPLKHPQAGF